MLRLPALVPEGGNTTAPSHTLHRTWTRASLQVCGPFLVSLPFINFHSSPSPPPYSPPLSISALPLPYPPTPTPFQSFVNYVWRNGN